MIFETLRCSRRRSYCSRRRPLAHSVLKLGDFFSVTSFNFHYRLLVFLLDILIANCNHFVRRCT